MPESDYSEDIAQINRNLQELLVEIRALRRCVEKDSRHRGAEVGRAVSKAITTAVASKPRRMCDPR